MTERKKEILELWLKGPTYRNPHAISEKLGCSLHEVTAAVFEHEKTPAAEETGDSCVAGYGWWGFDLGGEA